MASNNFISLGKLARLLRLGTGNDRFVSPPGFNVSQIFNPGTAQWERVNGNEFEIFETTGILQIIIGKKALMKSAGNWKHFRINSNGEAEDLGLTPIIERLNSPNPLQSKDEFLRELSILRDVHGANYSYKLGSKVAEAPAAIYNILPRFMTIKTSGRIYEQTDINEIISAFVFDEGGDAQRTYKADEILYRRLENPLNPVLPLSPFVGLTMEISNIRAAYGYRNVLLRKRGAIGILSNQAKTAEGAIPLNKEERQRIEKQYQKDYGISDSQMQIAITNASLNWQPLNFPTKDLMLFEEITEDMRRIIDAYGLNENLFSRDKQSTFTNVEAAERMVYSNTIIPESMDDAKAFSEYLGLTKKREFLTLDYSHLPILKDNEVMKTEILERKINAANVLAQNGMDLNAALEMVGLESEIPQ